MSDSYPHIADSCTAHQLRLYTASLAAHARGAGSNGQATGGAGASGVQWKEGQSSRMRWRGAGVRDLGDRLTKEKFNTCVADTPHNSPYNDEKGEGACGRIARDRLLQRKDTWVSRAFV